MIFLNLIPIIKVLYLKVYSVYKFKSYFEIIMINNFLEIN